MCIDDDGVLLFCLQGEVGEQGLVGHPGEKVSLLIFLFTQFILVINESAPTIHYILGKHFQVSRGILSFESSLHLFHAFVCLLNRFQYVLCISS